MPKKVLLLLAEGFEEVEAVTPLDYLQRAGIEVTSAAVGLDKGTKSLAVKGVHGITLIADTQLEVLAAEGSLSTSLWDGVVIPGGGPGSDKLAASAETGAFLKEMAAADKWICAICAAPARVLFPLGILNGKSFTCFPGGEEKVIANSQGAMWKEDRVVVDGNLITSRAAGTAGEFACAIIEKIESPDEAKTLIERVMM